ncbi:C2 family cysteine protease [Aerosakkonema sp. BLCC-F183]|uniref:C2 family cysteine protease n=1 Tax=Aerosakkonema sp. BLCC-F183 TaxID=3342834 RepID=UPI0035B6DC0C
MSIDLFDASYYQAANPDLAKAGITTEAQLRAHFETTGLNEGREFSPFVNLNVYRASNGDLQAAGLTTNQQLLAHLQNKGVAEGRNFSQFGDINFYLQSNNDVNQFFQGNREQAFLHLKNNGVKEGRLFSPVVDLNFYRDANSDLKSLDNNQALQHLAMFGVAEGREFSYPLNLNYYDLNNPDLLTYYAGSRNLSTEAVLDNPAELSSYNKFLLSHFATFGIREGRRSSDEFDVNYYRSANKDLASLSNEQLYNHFRNFGINELRAFSDSYDAEYYSKVSSAPNSSNLTSAQLFNYYITSGLQEGDRAVRNPKPPNEVLPGFDLVSGKGSISGILNASDGANLNRKGSYSEEYLLSGLDPGQQVQLDLTADYDAYLQLVDPITGEVIAENDNIGSGNANSRINFTVEPGTPYMVRVSGDNANAVGAFTLSGQASSTIVGNLAANGGNISDNLTNTDLPDPDEANAFKRDYRLDLTGVNPGQELKIVLNSSSFDTYLELINADTKEFIDSNDDSDDETTNSQLNFVVESGINYAVRVTSWDEQATGNFSLTSTLEAGANSQIGRDETVAGTFTPDGDPNKTDIYTLQGVNPGEQIRINVESETFDNSVRLLANGVPVSTNDDANGETDSELTLTVQPNTTYQIQVNRSDKDRAGDGHYTITTTPLTGEGSTVTLSDPGMQSLLANKTSLGREDVLSFFNQAAADGTVSVQEQADLKELASEAVALRMPDSVQFQLAQVNDAIDRTGQNTAVTATVLQNAMAAIKGINPLPLYIGAGDTANNKSNKPAVVQTNVEHLKIEGELYGKDNETRIRGINQGGLGDCTFMAALGAVFATPQSQQIIETGPFIKANGDGTYTFRFFDDNRETYYVTVDQTVATEKLNVNLPANVIALTNYNSIPFAKRGGTETDMQLPFPVKLNDGIIQNSTINPDRRVLLVNSDASIWGPLAEKAYAVFREITANAGFIQGIETRLNGAKVYGGYSLIGNGDNVKDPLERITGRTATAEFNVKTIGEEQITLYNDTLQRQVEFDELTNALNKGQAIEAGTHSKTENLVPLLVGSAKGTHAYSVTSTYLEPGGTQHVVVRNPWGKDNDDNLRNDPTRYSGDFYDGFIDLTFDQFKSGFGDLAIV